MGIFREKKIKQITWRESYEDFLNKTGSQSSLQMEQYILEADV